MSFQNCIETIQAAAGRKLSDDELDSLLTALKQREQYIRAKDASIDTREAAIQAADDLANTIKLAAVIEKRNAALNLVKRFEKVAWVQKNFGNNLAEGLEAILVGVNRAKEGAREGVAQVQEVLRRTYLSGFLSDVERTGNMALFSSGSMDRDIARAMWAIGSKDEAEVHAKLPKEAVEMGKVISKWQEVARLDGNEAGAWIGKITGYIVRQSHDAERIRGRGTTEDYHAWRQSALEHFDIARMVAEHGAENPEKMLSTLWSNLASGNHMKAVPENEISGFKGPANIAKKMSQDRSIHFKDADAWFDYNQVYGAKNLREAVVSGLSHNAESTGMMRILGTNPAAMFDTIKSDLVAAAKEAGKPEDIAKLQQKEGRLANYMASVDGSMNIAGNHLWARRMANVRSWEMMSKLGGMLLSQLNDIAVYGAGARYQGRSLFSGMAEATAGLGRNMKDGGVRELAASLGVTLDNMAGELSRIGAFNEPGGMAKASRLFMKLNLSGWWVDRMRTSASLGMSHHMALHVEHDWKGVGAEYQRVLGLYNITPEKWDVIRSAELKDVDGKAYLTPELIRDIPDSAIASYLTKTGQRDGPNAITQARRDIEGNLRNYFVDQTGYLALDPDAKSRAMMLQGTRPGTWTGETARFLMQFKSFTGAYMQKIIGRELFGRGYEGDSIMGALRNGNGEFQGLAQLIVMTTLLGYGSMALKDLSKGKTPRDPLENPVKVFLAAMVQGGGAGIYGDFLFGEASRTGSGTIESIGGPAISTAGRIIDIYHKAIHGDDAAANAFREAINNTPFINLFYTRAALDYMLFYRIQESMNPGYLRRMERNAEKQNAQHFLIRPSEVTK